MNTFFLIGPAAIPFGRFAPFVVFRRQVNFGVMLATLIALAVEKSKLRNQKIGIQNEPEDLKAKEKVSTIHKRTSCSLGTKNGSS